MATLPLITSRLPQWLRIFKEDYAFGRTDNEKPQWKSTQYIWVVVSRSKLKIASFQMQFRSVTEDTHHCIQDANACLLLCPVSYSFMDKFQSCSRSIFLFMKLYQGTARFIYIYIYCSGNNSGYFTCKQNMKLVTNKFKSGGLHEKHVVATWNVGNRLSICL